MTGRTIIFGDDGSASADVSWLWINCHTWTDWRLEIVTAESSIDFRVDPEGNKLHEWTPTNPRHVWAEADFDRVAHLRCGLDPRLALSRSADLVVIGQRGPGLAKTLHLGSTAEWLLAHPPAPLLIVRHGRRTLTAVVCSDGSAHAVAASRALATLPWIGDVAITVATVADGAVDVEAAFAAVAAPLTAAGAHVQHRLVHGEPTHELLAVLEELQPDLVVLGTRGLTGINRIRVGSTAAVVAHTVESSVLVACADAESPAG